MSYVICLRLLKIMKKMNRNNDAGIDFISKKTNINNDINNDIIRYILISGGSRNEIYKTDQCF